MKTYGVSVIIDGNAKKVTLDTKNDVRRFLAGIFEPIDDFTVIEDFDGRSRELGYTEISRILAV